MANKAAIDFGNSNTVIALWNDASGMAEVMHVPEYSAIDSFLIPSQITYEPDGRFFVGDQCRKKASPESKEFRWMKRYISLRSPYSLRVGTERIDARRAAEDFIQAVLAASFANEHSDEVIVSVPVDSFEHYSDWLLNGMNRLEGIPVRLVDEASAAAAGYGLHLHPGDTLLVLDFGGSTLQASVVTVAEEASVQGKACRVLGKAGCNLGGMTLDRWIFENVLQRLRLSENDPRVRGCSGALLRYCEEIKKILSEKELAVFDFFPENSFMLTRDDLTALFREQGLFTSLDHIINEALRTAEDHGFVRDQLTSVLPVGGSCLLPALRSWLEEHFTPEKVAYGEPLGAVARGAAVIAGGMHIYDFIQHNYAIRYNDPVTGGYAFRTIVPKGTKYPAETVTSVMKLKAAFEGQTRFGLAIYELQENTTLPISENELFFDENGAVHVLPLTEAEIRSGQMFWMNERDPFFLTADGDVERGVPRFSVSFGIDANKMLTVSAADLLSNKAVLTDYPVVRLV